MALDRYDVPDFVREAEEAMARGETLPAPPNEVTTKFGKGLMGEPFTSKSGKELVEVKIPNVDPNDHSPWESFVIPASFIHDNQYGKGVWMKLPEDGTTRLSRIVQQGQDTDGKRIWGKESREVSNMELKALVESYKDKSRGSVMDELSSKRAEVSSRPAAPHTPSRDDPAFR